MPTATPQPDELEVSVFGPSYGEAIVAKVGEAEWIAVDSCRNEDTGRSKPLEYLEEIGVDVARDVKAVIATHWHRDHIGGIAELVAAAKGATFFCPLSFRNKEFMTFAETFASGNGNPLVQRSSEYIRTLVALRETGRRPVFVAQDRRLLVTTNGATVYTLSPSDPQISDFLTGIGAELAALKEGREPSNLDTDPNHTAIVLMLNLGNHRVLLGADLEEEEVKGWSTIMTTSTIERDNISLIKVPHHGSSNAFHAPFWEKHISKECVSVLTPFASGSNPPPTRDDVARILSYTSNAYSAARIGSVSPAKLTNAFEKHVEEDGVQRRRRREPKMGQVRLRRGHADSSWSVQRFGNAVLLKDVFS